MVNRAVILGASNVSLGYPLICKYLFNSSDRPLELFSACGHGRSFGIWSRFIYRGLPGITESGIWDQLRLETEKKDHSRMSALITDIGNDLVYGVEVEQILEWVQSCLDRLKEYQAEITVTALPLGPILKLSATRYELTRRLFFGGKGLPWSEMKARVLALNEGIVQLTSENEVNLVKPENEWYGFDPIHIKRSKRPVAWKEILDCQNNQIKGKSGGFGFISSLSRKRWKRAEKTVMNKVKRTSQPVFESEQLTLYTY